MGASKNFKTYTPQEIALLWSACDEDITIPCPSEEELAYIRQRIYALRRAVSIAARRRQELEIKHKPIPEDLQDPIINRADIVSKITTSVSGLNLIVGVRVEQPRLSPIEQALASKNLPKNEEDIRKQLAKNAQKMGQTAPIMDPDDPVLLQAQSLLQSIAKQNTGKALLDEKVRELDKEDK